MVAYLIIVFFAALVAFGARIMVLARFPEVDFTADRDQKRSQSKERRHQRLMALAVALGGKLPAGAKESESIKMRLNRAGMRITPDVYNGLCAVSFIACMLVGYLASVGVLAFAGFAAALLALVFFAFAGLALPSYVVSSRIKRRTTQIESELPSALELLAITVRAGYPLERSIKLVGERTAGPLAEEFRIVDRELNMLSVPLARSLERLDTRVQSKSVQQFTLAVRQSQQQGTSISRVLESQAELARNEFYAKTLVKVNQLPNKMIPVIFVFFLPALVVMPLAPVIANVMATLQDVMPQISSALGR